MRQVRKVLLAVMLFGVVLICGACQAREQIGEGRGTSEADLLSRDTEEISEFADTGTYWYDIEELGASLEIPDGLYVYRTPGIYVDWENQWTTLDCVDWILITDKEYSQEYLTGGMVKEIKEELDHIVYYIVLIPKDMYPVWRLCFTVFDSDHIRLTEEGYCQYFDPGYRMDKKLGTDSSPAAYSNPLPGSLWTAVIEKNTKKINAGLYPASPMYQVNVYGGGANKQYGNTIVNEDWWQGYTQAVETMRENPERYSYDKELVQTQIGKLWDEYKEYVSAYGTREFGGALVNIYTDSEQDIHIRAGVKATGSSYDERPLEDYVVFYFEWWDGQRSFVVYSADELRKAKENPDFTPGLYSANYDYSVDLHISRDYIQSRRGE